MNEFIVLNDKDILELEAGCVCCKIGGVLGGAATGAGTVIGLASNPVGWAIAGGAIVGAGLGYLAAS